MTAWRHAKPPAQNGKRFEAGEAEGTDSSKGCTAAQPISDFQGQSVVYGLAIGDQASRCGSYHVGNPNWHEVSPSKPRTPQPPIRYDDRRGRPACPLNPHFSPLIFVNRRENPCLRAAFRLILPTGKSNSGSLPLLGLLVWFCLLTYAINGNMAGRMFAALGCRCLGCPESFWGSRSESAGPCPARGVGLGSLTFGLLYVSSSEPSEPLRT